jgi:GNAT superfamily N-acetyltransferase
MGSVAANDVQYAILRIPESSPRLPKIIAKFRDTKLSALYTSPSEWIYQHSAECNHPPSIWESRLANKNNVFVCVATKDATLPVDDLLVHGEWVAFAAVRGPLTYDEFYPDPDMQQPIPADPDVETRWHAYDLYTFPQHRGRGIARKLVAAILATCTAVSTTSDIQGFRAESQKRIERARIRLFVNAKNVPLVEMYERMGLEPAGSVSLKEGLIANGMGESIPEKEIMGAEEWEKRFETRIGTAMVKVVDLG